MIRCTMSRHCSFNGNDTVASAQSTPLPQHRSNILRSIMSRSAIHSSSSATRSSREKSALRGVVSGVWLHPTDGRLTWACENSAGDSANLSGETYDPPGVCGDLAAAAALIDISPCTGDGGGDFPDNDADIRKNRLGFVFLKSSKGRSDGCSAVSVRHTALTTLPVSLSALHALVSCDSPDSVPGANGSGNLILLPLRRRRTIRGICKPVEFPGVLRPV